MMVRKTVRKTLQWIATLLLLAGVGGGGYSYWFFTHSDEQLRAKVLELVASKLPNARVTIGRAWYWSRKVHLQNVTVSAKGLDQPLARCAELIVTLDGEQLSNELRIDIRAVRVVRPDVRVVRDVSGHWNWENILPLINPDEVCPEVNFEDLQIALQLAHAGAPSASFHLQQGGVRLVPSARRKFEVAVDARVSSVGDVHLDGGFDLDNRTWRLSAQTTGVQVGEVVESIARAAPETREKLAGFESRLNSVVRTASNEIESTAASAKLTESRVSGQAKISLELSRASTRDAMSYKVRVDLTQGEIEHPLLPFGLHGVAGTLYADDKGSLILQNAQAQNGSMRLSVDGRMNFREPAAANRFDVKIVDLALDDRLRSRLPTPLQRLYDSVRPEGQLDAGGGLVCSKDGRWEPVDWVIAAKHCTITHERFPYPMMDVVGTATQRGQAFVIDLAGRAGGRPVALTGQVVHPGPEAQADYALAVDRLPIDEMLLTAAEAQPPVHRTLNALNLRGLMDVRCRFHRAGGPNQKIDWKINARVTDASLEYEHFPYRISELSGRFQFDSTNGIWSFDDLRGRHGPAQLAGTGSFLKTDPNDRGLLKLEVRAEDVTIDRDFQQSFPSASQKLWDLVYPTGKLKTQIVLSWSPGSKPEIQVPEAIVTGGSLEIRAFPYSLDHVVARFAYARDPVSDCDRISILHFQARHDETKIRTDDKGQSFVLCPPADDPVGEWRIRLERLLVDDLTPDRTLRRALPLSIRNTVNVLNPQGTLSLDGMLELRGTRRAGDPVTAAWDFSAIASGATIAAGVELKNVNGKVKSWGLWDGRNIRMQGWVDLLSAFAWNHQFTKIVGPFNLANQELVVGSARAFAPVAAGAQAESIPDSQRMTARAVDGTFLLDAQAHLDAEKTRYHVKAVMRNASLGRYARDYIPSQSTLRGVMNGWIDVSGNSPDPKDVTGRGQLLIHPAALYELPVFVQIFKAFSLAPPNNTAFNYALASFNIANRAVEFREIDLIGDALSLRGKGWARFDGALRLNFYSRPANAWQRSIFRDFANQFGAGWVGVLVAGTVQQPQARSIALPQMNDAFRKFLDAFNPNPNGLPPVNPPWMTTFPMMPMGGRPQSANAAQSANATQSANAGQPANPPQAANVPQAGSATQ